MILGSLAGKKSVHNSSFENPGTRQESSRPKLTTSAYCAPRNVSLVFLSTDCLRPVCTNTPIGNNRFRFKCSSSVDWASPWRSYVWCYSSGLLDTSTMNSPSSQLLGRLEAIAMMNFAKKHADHNGEKLKRAGIPQLWHHSVSNSHRTSRAMCKHFCCFACCFARRFACCLQCEWGLNCLKCSDVTDLCLFNTLRNRPGHQGAMDFLTYAMNLSRVFPINTISF